MQSLNNSKQPSKKHQDLQSGDADAGKKARLTVSPSHMGKRVGFVHVCVPLQLPKTHGRLVGGENTHGEEPSVGRKSRGTCYAHQQYQQVRHVAHYFQILKAFGEPNHLRSGIG